MQIKIDKINKLNNQQSHSNSNYHKQQNTNGFSDVLKESIQELKENENEFKTCN